MPQILWKKSCSRIKSSKLDEKTHLSNKQLERIICKVKLEELRTTFSTFVETVVQELRNTERNTDARSRRVLDMVLNYQRLLSEQCLQYEKLMVLESKLKALRKIVRAFHVKKLNFQLKNLKL